MLDYSAEELKVMIQECGVTHLSHFGGHLSKTFKAAKEDRHLLELLKGLTSITFGGLPATEKDGEWANENGIRLRVSTSSPVVFQRLVA